MKTVADAETSGGGARNRNMKYKPPRLAAIFFGLLDPLLEDLTVDTSPIIMSKFTIYLKLVTSNY